MSVAVSVVIPCFNRRDMVADAIESALAQGDNVEIVVVDDGSTDGSDQAIAGFGDRIRVLRTENRGVSAARNRGVEVASGRFLRFLDSDDLIPPGALDRQLEAAERLGSREIGVGDAQWVGADGRVLGDAGYGYGSLAEPGPIPKATVLGRIMPPVLPLFPAEALREVGGFDTRFTLGEDQELAIRLLAAGYAFVRVPTIVCTVREHGGERLSRSIGADGYARLADTYAQCGATLAAAPVTAEEGGAFGRLIWRAARDASREGYPEEAARLFTLAEEAGGNRAREGSLPVRLLYGLLPPYQAERLVAAAKRALGIGS